MTAAIKFRIPLKCSCGKKGFDFISWNGQFFESDHVTPCCDDGKHEIVGEPQQYAGITIKNVDLWQDDIVRMKSGMLNIIYVGQARTEEPYEFKLQALDKSGFTFDFRNIDEIIGNVHENPKLLEEKSHA